MISREQVADLRAGDVVEIRSERWPLVVMRGPLHEERGWLSLGPWGVREPNGDPYLDLGNKSTRNLTVIERAPRPLYVNHDRAEPAPGDVFQPEHGQWPIWVTQGTSDELRFCENRESAAVVWRSRHELPDRLRLLVDGTTGQVVP